MTDHPDIPAADAKEATPADPSALDADQICDRVLQEQWANAERQVVLTAEEVFQRYPTLAQNPDRQVDVVYNEFLIACERDPGRNSDPQAYVDRFPNLEAKLRRQFQLHACLSSGFDDEHVGLSDPSVVDLSGTLLQDRYEVLEQIGSGGVADVYRVHDRQLRRDVALKMSRTPYASDSQPFQRFLREAESAASLTHPGIVQVFEFGDFHGRPYIVGQLVRNGTLAEVVRNVPGTREGIRRLCDWMVQICEATDYAHQCGIVHRDLKPANILFDDESRPLIADFGLAALLDADSKLTSHGDIVGTPAYMSPEQATAEDVGPLSDVYSLGVILYELLTGRLPYTGSTVAVLHQLQNDAPPDPQAFNSAVSADMKTICLKAMSRLPADRYSTARAMADDLNRLRRDEPILARPLRMPEQFTRLIRRHPAISLMTFLLLLVTGFTLGGSLQYLNVVDQRDRANEAEARTLELLAQDAAVSGQLAQQQGFTRNAIERYREAIDRDHEQKGDLLYRLAECELVLGNTAFASEYLNKSLTAGVSSASESDIQLLKARLALSGIDDYGSADELLESIDSEGLDDADRQYLSGLKADTSPEALAAFRKAMELDSYHHPARKMAGILALSLADFVQAEEIAVISHQLFPDDPDFVLIEALAHAGRGDGELPVSLMEEVLSDEQERASWHDLASFLMELRTEHHTGGERVFHEHLSADESELSFDGMVELLNEFKNRFGNLLNERSWYLPPSIESSFSQFLSAAERAKQANALVELLTSGRSSDQLTQAGFAVIRTHPEGTFTTVIARHLLDLGATTPQDLQQMQQFFETAVSAKSFAADVREHALLGSFAVASRLLLVDKIDTEQNLQRANELMDQMQPASVTEVETARVMTLLPLTYGDWDRADRYVSRWVELAREAGDNEMLVSALWHVAVIHEHRGEWSQVAETCDQILELSPDPNGRDALIAPEGLRDKASVEMTDLLTEKDLLHWGQFVRYALDQKQIDLAEFGLKRVKNETVADQEFVKDCKRRLDELRSSKAVDADSNPDLPEKSSTGQR